MLPVGVLMASTAHASTVEVTTADEMETQLNEGAVEVVRLTAPLEDSDKKFIYVNLEGRNKVLEMGDYSLPPMHIGNGELTVVGGRVDDFTVSAANEARAGAGWPFELTHHLIKVYGDTTVTLEGTVIDLPPETDDNPAFPPSVFALYSPAFDPLNPDASPSSSPANLELRSLATGEPLSRALVLSTALSPQVTQLLVKDVDLVFSSGGTLHASWWGEDGEVDPIDDASVYLTSSKLLWSVDDGDQAAGLLFTPSTGDTLRLPFLQGAGRVFVENTLMSKFATEGSALVEAPRVEFREILMDKLVRYDGGGKGGALAEGINIAMAGSLICGVNGGHAVFYAEQPADSDLKRSVHVMSSALWKVEPSLFGMSLPDTQEADESEEGLFARNVTLHHVSEGTSDEGERTPIVYRQDDHQVAPGELLNLYAQGQWMLGDAVRKTESDDGLLAESVVMSDPERTDGEPCGDYEGCQSAPERHLSAGLVNHTCEDVIAALVRELDGEAVGFEHSLQDVQPEQVDDDFRAALVVDVVGFVEPGVWSFDSTARGEWDETQLNCNLSDGASSSTYVGGYRSEVGTCTLPILKPIELDTDPPEDGTTDSENAELFGLATGCRSRLAGGLLVLPLLGLRRRD